MKNTRTPKKNGKLTPERQNRLAANLQRGCSIEAAAAIAGISKTTFYSWMRRGRRELDRLEAEADALATSEADAPAVPNPEETIYADFWQAVESAVAELEARNIRIIEAAAKGGCELVETITVLDASNNPSKHTAKVKIAKPEWQAAKWLLERRFPGRWAKPRLETAQTNGPEQAPNAQDAPDLSQLNAEELAALETLLEKTTGPGTRSQGNG